MQPVILSATRTPIGAFMGSLSSKSAPELGSVVIREAMNRAGIGNDDVNEVIMGNVLTGGVGQAPARQAMVYAGLPKSVEAMTINKVCGSGLKSVMIADQQIQLGEADCIVAGGQESMTNAPYALFKARTGYRMGNGELVDLMIHDGLWDVYNNFHMGLAGELCSTEYKISREEQDEYASMSYQRAQEAQNNGWFDEEIVPVEIPSKKETINVDKDDEPGKIKFDKVGKLKPVFKKEGTVTAANASSIDDGASALVVTSAEKAEKLGQKPIAKIVAHVSHAQEPEWFTTAPATAIKKVLKKANMTLDQIDLFEVNEAFSVVPIVTKQLAEVSYDKMNVHGGAVALGHPIGCSGARVLTTLLHALKQKGGKYGLATLCIGGGEAVAMIVEMAE